MYLMYRRRLQKGILIRHLFVLSDVRSGPYQAEIRRSGMRREASVCQADVFGKYLHGRGPFNMYRSIGGRCFGIAHML